MAALLCCLLLAQVGFKMENQEMEHIFQISPGSKNSLNLNFIIWFKVSFQNVGHSHIQMLIFFKACLEQWKEYRLVGKQPGFQSYFSCFREENYMLNDRSCSDAHVNMNPFGSKQLSQQRLSLMECWQCTWHSGNVNFLDVLFYISVSLQR